MLLMVHSSTNKDFDEHNDLKTQFLKLPDQTSYHYYLDVRTVD